MTIKNVSFYVIAEPAKGPVFMLHGRKSYPDMARKDNQMALKIYPANPCLDFSMDAVVNLRMPPHPRPALQ